MKDHANKDWLKVPHKPSGPAELLAVIAVAGTAVFIPIAAWWLS